MSVDAQLIDSVPSAALLARSTLGASRQVGQLMAQLRQAKWWDARATAAMVFGIGELSLAEIRFQTSASGAEGRGAQAASEFTTAFASMNPQQRQQFADRLEEAAQAPGQEGDLLPALLALLGGDSAPLIKMYAEAARLSDLSMTRLTALASALGMVSVGVRAAFWSTFNLAYSDTSNVDDADWHLALLTSAVEAQSATLHDHGVAVHAAVASAEPQKIRNSCDQFAATSLRVSSALAGALGPAMRFADDKFEAGRDNTTLRRIQAVGATGMRLAQQSFAGQVSSHLLRTTLDGAWESAASRRLLAGARKAPAIQPGDNATPTLSLPAPVPDSDAEVLIEGRVTRLTASRQGRKLITNFSVSVGRRRPEIQCLAEFHDLGHEGLTVGAFARVQGKVVDSSGNRVLRVGRVSRSDPVRDGWLNSWFGLAHPWVELSPGALDISWSPGHGVLVTPESQKLGVGVGDVVFNKPVPRGGFDHV